MQFIKYFTIFVFLAVQYSSQHRYNVEEQLKNDVTEETTPSSYLFQVDTDILTDPNPNEIDVKDLKKDYDDSSNSIDDFLKQWNHVLGESDKEYEKIQTNTGNAFDRALSNVLLRYSGNVNCNVTFSNSFLNSIYRECIQIDTINDLTLKNKKLQNHFEKYLNFII
uniref:Plasmodium variant antigen protein Cir/Yir/Bir n=1 Tax=Strongyloides papillosus TaxID=174720 RepID=A0A0N5BEG1_STREA